MAKQVQSPLQFTEADLAAAEQLIHLSESSGGATSAFSARPVNAPTQLDADAADDDECLWRRNKRYRLIADLYASTAQIGGAKNEENRKRTPTQLDADMADDDECLSRRNNRYRLISDLYASTAQIGGAKNEENRKRKGAKNEE